MPYHFPATDTPVRYPIEAYVYVLRFGSGLVKVGYSADPSKRVRQHQDLANSYGNPVTAQWVSTPHTKAAANEKALIAFCAERATAVAGREFFKGVDFDAVVSFAGSLPLHRATADEVAELEARAEATKKAFAAALRPIRDERVIQLPEQLDTTYLANLPVGDAANAVALMADLLGISVEEAERLPHDAQLRVVEMTAMFWNANRDAEFFAGLLREVEQRKDSLLTQGLAALRRDVRSVIAGGAA
jgi:hypothetical protein